MARLPSSSVAKMRVMRSNLTTFAPDPETLASSIYITIAMFAIPLINLLLHEHEV